MKARSAVLVCCPLCFGALLAISQSGGPPNHGVSTTPNNPIVTHGGSNTDYSTFGLPTDSTGMNSTELARRAQIARAFAEERIKQNAADVTKLVALAKSLNDGFAEPGISTSNEDQLRKLKEIEKLAGRVKHRTAAPTTLQVALPQ